MSVYVNRVINLKKIKAIGFDMDHTLVRYKTENFEEFTYQSVKKYLFENKNYPKEMNSFEFDFHRTIQGLAIDMFRGNILKLSTWGKVKTSYHGTEMIDFGLQKKLYGSKEIDLKDPGMKSLDTSFSTCFGILFPQLVDLKDSGVKLPDYETLANDVLFAIDVVHRDGTLKDEVRDNIEKYIIQDPMMPKLLESYAQNGKKLIIITNSEYSYTKLLLDYTVNPFLTSYKDWSELFDITVCFSCKPKFFTHQNDFLQVHPETGHMSNFFDKVDHGIFQGGNALKLEEDLGLKPDEILYLGDHIYGDVVSLKKTFQWRTGLVFWPLDEERIALEKAKPLQVKIDTLMDEKEVIEIELNSLFSKKYHDSIDPEKKTLGHLFSEIDRLNHEISSLIEEYRTHFNSHWGEMMRAGNEESRLAGQIQKFACVYMSKVTDLLEYSPKAYFRPKKRVLPHEIF